ncbi:MAG: ferredoxin [Phycisphaerae bacterium]
MAKYQIEINREACIGDQQCCQEAPKTFEMDADNLVFVRDPEGDPPEHILAAAKVCPTDVIILRDAETGKQVWPEA